MNESRGVDNTDWQQNQALGKWADRRGFADPRPMTSAAFASLKSAEGESPRGIYVWEGRQGSVYLGISEVDITARLKSHLVNYSSEDPQQFRFLRLSTPKRELRTLEREMTHDLQRQNFVVIGREHTASLTSREPHTSVFSPLEEIEWRRSPASVNLRTLPERGVPALGADERSRSTFEKFMLRKDSEEIIDSISIYLRECVPFSARSENVLWTMSCLPNWKDAAGNKRIVTVSLGFQEVLWFAQNPAGGAATVSMSYDGQDKRRSLSLIPLVRFGVFPGVQTHKRGGPYEKTARFSSSSSFLKAMTRSSALRAAGADFALDQVRQRRVPGKWRDSHNSVLAAEAYARMAEARLAHK